jgi:SAM-dependent methyltransferase
VPRRGWSAESPVATSDEVIAELQRRAQTDPRLPQFKAIASAHQYRRLHALAQRLLPPGASVLDWGAGNGHFSTFLVRAGYRATGYSFEPFDFVEALRAPGYVAVPGDPASPVRLPFADGSFDAVVSCGVLEHVREFKGTESGSMAEIARILRPGGVFLCYHFPNASSWIEFGSRLTPGKYAHRYRFTEADIRALAGGAGLELEELGRYQVIPRNLWGRLPRALRDSRPLAHLVDALESVVATVARPIAQNWFFVARKP